MTPTGRGEGCRYGCHPFASPRIWVLDVRAPYDPLGRVGVRLSPPSRDRDGGIPGFRPKRACKPGDPPPPSRPAAAEASARNRSLSRPHTRASLAKGDSKDYRQFYLSKAQDSYTGELATIGVAARKVVFRSVEARTDKARSYRVIGASNTGDVELGAAWQKRNEEGRDYSRSSSTIRRCRSRFNCAMVESTDGEGFILVWLRDTRKAKAESPAEAARKCCP